MLVDTHCHLDWNAFDADRDAVIRRAIESGVTRLLTIGVDVHFKSTVGDNLDRITATLRGALRRADFVLTTGGIGPPLFSFWE